MNEDTSFYIALIILAVLVVLIIIALISKKKKEKLIDAWLEQHPNACKIYLQKKIGVKSGTISVFYVNKEKPKIKIEKAMNVLYVEPGKNTIEVSYIFTRPGVASTITETYGPAEVVVDVEDGKEYEITFDREKKMFSYNEKSN